MKKNVLSRVLSLFLALILALGTVPVTVISAYAEGAPEMLVTSLTELYSGDETRAREDLEALSAAGLLGADGKLIDLDIRENGESITLSALAERIAKGETVGTITVNGNAATAEQIVQIQSVQAAIEIAELLDEEIDVTDEHVENLEGLLTGIQNGNVDLETALESGTLSLKSANTGTLSLQSADTATPKEETNALEGSYKGWDLYKFGAPDLVYSGYYKDKSVYKLPADAVDDNLTGYYDQYFNGSEYEENHFFQFRDMALHQNQMTRRYYYIDNRYTGDASGTIGTTGKNEFIDWNNVKWGIDSSKGKGATVTILLPLKSDESLQDQIKQWITNESASCQTSGSGIAMSLPEPYGATTINFYMTSMYFGTKDYTYWDTIIPGKKYPVYVVTSSGEQPVALVARYSPVTNNEAYLRKETVNLYMKSAIEATAGFNWENAPTDPLGYHYYAGTSWNKVSGTSYSYYVGTLAKINLDQYVSRTQQYVNLNNGFIKLTDDNTEFPYVYLKDESHPELQCDLEIRVTEDMYNILSKDPKVLYMGEDQDLRLTYQISDRIDFDCVTPKEDIRYKILIRDSGGGYMVGGGDVLESSDDGRVYTLNPTKPGEASHLYLVALNGSSDDTANTCTRHDIELAVKEGSAPYMMIPRSSRTRETMSGVSTDIFFSSNAAQSNNRNTDITLKLYSFDGGDIDSFTPSGTPYYTTKGTSTVANPLTHITIPGEKLTAGNYAVVLSTSIGGTTMTAKALLKVKQSPAKVTLDKLDSYYVEKSDLPNISYTLTSAAEGAEVKYTIQQSGGEVSAMQDASDGTIPFTADTVGTFEGLKKAYTITVYARNKDEDPWSVDSMLLTVYNTNPLKLILKDVPFGEVGGTTGGKAGDGSSEAGTSLVLDNSDDIQTLLKKLSSDANYSFDDLRSDVNLQKLISANYGSGAWGIISDKMQWSATEGTGDNKTASDRVTLNYEERGNYADLRSYSYTSFIPTSDFLIVATDDVSGEAPVTITAKHVSTGMTKDVTVSVNTLKNKLYLFRFNPKAQTTVTYYTTDNQPHTVTTNSNGELAIYEAGGITGDIVAMSKVGDETYIGTYNSKDFVSGEQNIVKLELYPCNNLTLKPISSTTLTFLQPNGQPYTGEVILRGGVYVNGDYCSEADLRNTNSTDAERYLRKDMTVNIGADGKTTVWLDPTQFIPTSGGIRRLQYVFEYRFESGYQPGYVIIDVASNNHTNSIVNLQTLRGSGNVPTIVRQEYQQYYWDANAKQYRATDYTRNVIDYTDNIGISPDFSKAELYTDAVMLGESVGTDENGFSTYSGENAASFALYTAGGTLLTGQNKLSEAKTITKLDELDNATYFVFPFSTVPMLRSTYTMTNTDMTADGIGGDTPTARIKAVFKKSDVTVRTITMPFGVTNVSQKTSLKDGTTGALAIGKEVRSELNSKTDIGSIFRSINVNDMIKKGFVFLGNLAGAGGYNPINMMILPTADPSTFRIIAFVGSNARKESDASEGGVSVNFNTDDLAEDMSKYMKEMEDDGDDSDSNGEGSMEFNFYGTIILEARVGNGNWNIEFRGGNVGTNVKGKYEWGQTFMCGPYPAYISFEVGFNADLEVAFGNKDSARAMLLDAALGVSIEAFAGLGFDLSLVALQLGIYGRIGADVNFLLLTPSDESAKTGTKLTIAGEIGIKLKVKLLFISYTKKFASTGFDWTKKWNNYDKIKDYWNDQGFAQLFGTTRSGRAYTMYLYADGSTIVEIDGGAELESRDYLELSERAWTSGVSLMRAAGPMTGAFNNVQTNAYPYSHPAFTDDGELFLYVSDNDNASEVESVVSYAVKNGNGYDNAGRVDTSEDNVLADLDIVASGTRDSAFAAWVKQIETPQAEQHENVSNDELTMMFNATEVYAASYNGTAWTTTRLTDNSVADMAPTVASYGDKAIVAWRSLNTTSLSVNGMDDLTAAFNVENNINYRIYNGTEWMTAQVAYNGNAGTVNAIDSAMLADGTAILVYTVRTGEDVTTTETFYTVINANGETVTTGRLTNDSYTDTNVQVTAVNENGGYFVLGWYSEHDAGQGTTAAEYDAEGNVTATKAVVAHDIRLARINANGSYDISFPESVGGTGETGITADFHFSAPVNNGNLENVSVVWSQRKNSDTAEDAGKYELNAIRFYKADGVTGMTAPTDIAETDKNYTIDRFDAYTDSAGAIHAIILGTDYNTIEGIDTYDSIDLDAAAGNTVDSNSAEPNNLDILDGEAISSLKLATGTFPETAANVTADINISEVMPGFTTPVQFTVTNTGTDKLTSVTAKVGSQSKDFTDLNLLPNQSTTLLMSYSVPEGAVADATYSVAANSQALATGTLALNRPDVGISGIKLLQEYDGKRDIQITLSNSSEIPLSGSGKTVKLAFYKDPFHERMIGSEVSITGTALADIDAGTYTTVQTLNVTDVVRLNDDGEIPEDGATVYVRAWVDGVEEPNTYNNDNFISLTGLLARNNGEKLTIDTSVEANTNEQSEVTGYTVYADIRNNSMHAPGDMIPVAVLLDSTGREIARKDMLTEANPLQLGAEGRNSDLHVVIPVEEVNNGEPATPAQAVIRFRYKVSFDTTTNGGSGDISAVYTDMEGKIALPEGKPTPPEGKGNVFTGWYTAAENGTKITANTVFTESTTAYAKYVTHFHEFSYRVDAQDSSKIIATCADSDHYCYLEDLTATMQITAPTLTVYGGTGSVAATVSNGLDGVDTPTVVYKKGETELTAAPTGAGTYTASITVGTGDNAATASVEYTIGCATMTDVSVAQKGTLTYTGSAQTPQVTTAATTVNNQKVTFTYSKTENGPFGAMPTFTNVADAGTVYYKASAPNHEPVTGSFTVTMNKANQTAPAAPALAAHTAKTITLTEVEGCEYSKDGTTWQESATFTDLAKGKEYTFYQRLKETANCNASPSSAAATISTSDHDHQWGFTADGATISATCLNEDEGHSGELSATITITRPALTVYGGTGSAAATVTNGVDGVDTPIVVYKQGEKVLTATPTDAGTYTASITVGTGDNAATASVTYTIEKKSVTLTADNKTMTYGDAEPTLTATNTDLVGNDTLNYTLSRVEGNNVGEYVITVTLGDNPNYDVTAINAKLTINKKAASITADNKSKTYGDADPALTATATDLVGSDTLNYTLSRAEGENVGEYAISITLGNNPNYDVSVTGAKLTIDKKDASVTADAKSKTYGDADPTLTAAVEGTVGDYALNYTLTRAEGENVGDYTITVTLGENPNYNVSAAGGSFTITKKPVTLTAVDVGKIFSESDPALTATNTDLVGEDTLNYTLSRAEGENAGEYVITVTPGENPNYDVTAVNGVFTIGKKPATITVTNLSKVYGEDDPALEATVEGTVGDDTLEYTLSRAEGKNAGEYVITATPGENPNYDVTVLNGLFTILKKSAGVVVTVHNAGKVYGEGDPRLTATVSGLEGDDTLDYTLSRAGGEDVGTYTISVRLGGNANYEAATLNGLFTISQKPATIIANNVSKVYGEDDPALTATTANVESGDTLNYTLSRAEGENVGEYRITVRLGDNPNYDVSTVGGKLTITKADPAPATFTEEKIVYNGTKQALMAVAGTVKGGRVMYALSTSALAAPEEGWSTEIPTETNAGTYYVWYKVVGDENHNDTEPACVEVAIAPDYGVASMSGLSGANEDQWTKSSDNGLAITMKPSGEEDSLAHFVGVRLDGEDLVRDVDYTIGEDGATVTLNPETLEALAPGKHTVTVVYDNGEADTTFTVSAADSHVGLWIAVAAVSVAAMVVILLFVRKKKAKKQ